MPHTLTGHDLTFHRTNAGAVVPTCSCRWVGAPVHAYVVAGSAPGARERAYERAMATAAREHRDHAADVGPLTATLPIEQFIPTVRRLGRFGHA